MSERDINILLWTLSIMIVAVGIAQLCFTSSNVGGWSSIAVGASLIAVAASTRKKIKNG